MWEGTRAQAERSTPKVSNKPQAGGLMAEWNARPTMCVYCAIYKLPCLALGGGHPWDRNLIVPSPAVSSPSFYR